MNLLWDAGRKCVDLIEGYRASGYALPGWRKAKDWRRQLKNLQRSTSQIVYRGGPNKEARVKSAVREYLAVGRALAAKVQSSLLELCDLSVCATRWEHLAYFHAMLAKHLDLVARRLLNGETIPPHEKVFSLFEPHTEWIQKGKQRPHVELGHKFLIATDQHQLIQDYAVLLGEAEMDQSIPVADRLLGRYGAGSVASLSFDKGFTRTADRELLSLYVPTVVMPKRGKKNAAETERESVKQFVALRHQHSRGVAKVCDVICRTPTNVAGYLLSLALKGEMAFFGSETAFLDKASARRSVSAVQMDVGSSLPRPIPGPR